MNKSDDINELIGALSKAQGIFSSARKKRANNFLRSKYADLACVLDACREGLAENGLAVSQILSMEGEKVSLTTLLGHSSGQWVSSILILPAAKPSTKELPETKPNAQELGTSLTYMRRYSLMAILNIAQDDDCDDDDAEGAVRPCRQEPKPYKDIIPESRILTEEQCAKLDLYIEEFPEGKDWMCIKYGIKTVYGLHQDNFDMVCRAFEKKKQAKAEEAHG